jgi:hypothetical protein
MVTVIIATVRGGGRGALAQVPPADLDIAILGQLAPELPLGDALETGSLEGQR